MDALLEQSNCCDQRSCPRRAQLVLAAPGEVPCGCSGQIDPEQAAHFVGFGDLWCTPDASRVLNAWDIGGSRTRILEGLRNRRLVLLSPLRTKPGSGHVQRPDQPLDPDDPGPLPETTAWIHFRVIDDETGEALPGVTVRLREPNGREHDYVTRADGRIEVDPALPPDCDIVEVISEPLLEVLRIDSR